MKFLIFVIACLTIVTVQAAETPVTDYQDVVGDYAGKLVNQNRLVLPIKLHIEVKTVPYLNPTTKLIESQSYLIGYMDVSPGTTEYDRETFQTGNFDAAADRVLLDETLSDGGVSGQPALHSELDLHLTFLPNGRITLAGKYNAPYAQSDISLAKVKSAKKPSPQK